MSRLEVSPHGGDIYKTAVKLGIRKENMLDYSVNINPFGIPKKLRELMTESIDDLVNYPDSDCMELKAAISRYLDVDENRIIIGNGASEIIFLALDVLRPKKILIPAPAFSEYINAAEAFGTEVRHLRLKEENGFKLDIRRLLDSLEAGFDALFLGNPNNPTSSIIPLAELKYLAEELGKKNIKLILDEAFIELTADPKGNSMVGYSGGMENLFIIRSFTKVFAVPGLRLGYGIGSSDIITRMWNKKITWSVNSFACSIGGMLNSISGYLEETNCWIREETEQFFKRLSKYSCLKPYKPATNFILVRLLDKRVTSGILKQEMASRGVLIRDASNFKYLDDKFVRFAIKDRNNNEIFFEVLEDSLRSLGCML